MPTCYSPSYDIKAIIPVDVINSNFSDANCLRQVEMMIRLTHPKQAICYRYGDVWSCQFAAARPSSCPCENVPNAISCGKLRQ